VQPSLPAELRVQARLRPELRAAVRSQYGLPACLFSKRLPTVDQVKSAFMTTPTARWEDLPAAVRDAVQARAGTVTAAAVTGEGLNTAVRLTLQTPGGPVFVKGTGPGSNVHQAWKLDLAARMAPHVTAVSPPLLWRVQADGWDILGYPALPGRPWADQTPGSPDLEKILAVVRQVESIPAPPWLDYTAADCWARYVTDPSPFDGDYLAHRDLNPTNFVVSDDRAWLVDWGWAVRGPAWLTAAHLVIALMEADWEPWPAEQAVAALPAWRAANPLHIDAFAQATVGMWNEVLAENPGWPRDWRAGIARTWASYRGRLAGVRQTS
jgi:hypothetical protein